MLAAEISSSMSAQSLFIRGIPVDTFKLEKIAVNAVKSLKNAKKNHSFRLIAISGQTRSVTYFFYFKIRLPNSSLFECFNRIEIRPRNDLAIQTFLAVVDVIFNILNF